MRLDELRIIWGSRLKTMRSQMWGFSSESEAQRHSAQVDQLEACLEELNQVNDIPMIRDCVDEALQWEASLIEGKLSFLNLSPDEKMREAANAVRVMVLSYARKFNVSKEDLIVELERRGL